MFTLRLSSRLTNQSVLANASFITCHWIVWIVEVIAFSGGGLMVLMFAVEGMVWLFGGESYVWGRRGKEGV